MSKRAGGLLPAVRRLVCVLRMTPMDGVEDVFPLLNVYTKALQRLSGTAVLADERGVVRSGQSRRRGVRLAALGADRNPKPIVFHRNSSTLR